METVDKSTDRIPERLTTIIEQQAMRAVLSYMIYVAKRVLRRRQGNCLSRVTSKPSRPYGSLSCPWSVTTVSVDIQRQSDMRSPSVDAQFVHSFPRPSSTLHSSPCHEFVLVCSTTWASSTFSLGRGLQGRQAITRSSASASRAVRNSCNGVNPCKASASPSDMVLALLATSLLSSARLQHCSLRVFQRPLRACQT